MLLIFSTIPNIAKSQVSSDEAEHVTVFYEEGRYGGWPAKIGIWNWNDEILVGFIDAEYRQTEGFHTYNQTTARTKFARSMDGGYTWTIEDAYEQRQTARVDMAKNNESAVREVFFNAKIVTDRFHVV